MPIKTLTRLIVSVAELRWSREGRDLQAVFRRLRTIATISTGWLVMATLANTAALHWRLGDAITLTFESLAFLADRQSGAARLIQGLVQIGGAVVMWFAAWMALDLQVQDYFGRFYREVKRMQKLLDVRDHYVVCGAGRVGMHLAELLVAQRCEIVVIERAPAAIEAARANGWLVVEGDALDEDSLRRAGIERARGLITVMPETEKNVLAVLAGRELNPDLRVYARADNPDYIGRLRRAGADEVFLPEYSCAEQIAAAAQTDPARRATRGA